MTIKIQAEKCCDETTTTASSACCSDSSRSETAESVKENVRSKYAEAAQSKSGCGCGVSDEVNFMDDTYEGHEGYENAADLNLGCGIPTDLADIHEGHAVLDLGAGGGIDAFIARKLVGDSGSVTGLDLTAEMVELARKNAEQLGYDNVEFIQGDIEAMPLANEQYDRVLSNCVINLVPDKQRAFSEMYRVLKGGGTFTISDIVIDGDLPPLVRQSAELYAGCVSGAVTRDEYIDVLEHLGFENIVIHKENVLDLPDELLRRFASEEDVARFRASGSCIKSITLSASRPVAGKES